MVPGASPSVAAEEVCTRRGTPAGAAARTAATAPSTLTRRIGSGSSTQNAFMPATWKASSAPSMPRTSAASSSTSPRATSAPRALQGGGGRVGARERDDVVSARHEALDERAADHPAAAGDEDAAHEIERSEAENFSR